MTEDAWLKSEREFFVGQYFVELGIDEKKLNKAIEKYNGFLQKALFGESPYVAEDLKWTMVKSQEKAV